MFKRIVNGLELTLALILFAAISGYSSPSISNEIEKVRFFTRQIEFNYLSWMSNAALIKLRSASIGVPFTLTHEAQKEIVANYLRTTQSVLDQEYIVEKIYSDPAISDKEIASSVNRNELTKLYSRQNELAPLAEAVLQDQVSQILAELGLTSLGQTIPNVWYHSTPLPLALVVSPRDHIEQIANISIETDLTIAERSVLEGRVDESLNTSTLVVPIGGVGVYPTMVMRTTDTNWMLSTVAHEWIHNYLTLRPLGLLYNGSPELHYE